MRDYFTYMNVTDSRLAYKIETFSVNTIKLNFKSEKKFKSDGWICEDCKDTGSEVGEEGGGGGGGGGAIQLSRIPYSEAKVTVGNIRQPGGYLDSQEHVLFHCEKNISLRIGKQLDNLQHCVSVFKQVLARRAKQAKLSENML